MKNIFFLIVLNCNFLCYSQTFNLKPVDSEKIEKGLKSGKTEDDVYIYLKLNYKPLGKPTGKKYDTDFEENPLCAFTQKFERGIIYKVNSCGEGNGIHSTLTLPKMDITMLKRWIVEFHNREQQNINNIWDKTGLNYKPADDGAGCYYTIKQTSHNTIVEIYCGC